MEAVTESFQALSLRNFIKREREKEKKITRDTFLAFYRVFFNGRDATFSFLEQAHSLKLEHIDEKMMSFLRENTGSLWEGLESIVILAKNIAKVACPLHALESKDALQLALFIKILLPNVSDSITIFKKHSPILKRTIERRDGIVYVLLKSKRVFNKKADEISGASKKIKPMVLIDENDTVTLAKEVRTIKKGYLFEINKIYHDLQQRNSSFIPKFYSFTNLEDGFASRIVMENFDGDLSVFLSNLMNTTSYLPLIPKMSLLKQCALALSFLHTQLQEPCAHFDVKLQNFLFKYENGFVRIVLCDFDMCTYISDFSERTEGPSRPIAYGTLYYSSPELFSSPNVLDFLKMDIWALGLVFYSIYTESYPPEILHREPYQSNIQDLNLSLCANINHIYSELRKKYEKTEDEKEKLLIDVILRMLEKDPQQRPPIEEIIAFFDKLEISDTLKIIISSGKKNPNLKLQRPLSDFRVRELIPLKERADSRDLLTTPQKDL